MKKYLTTLLIMTAILMADEKPTKDYIKVSSIVTDKEVVINISKAEMTCIQEFNNPENPSTVVYCYPKDRKKWAQNPLKY